VAIRMRLTALNLSSSVHNFHSTSSSSKMASWDLHLFLSGGILFISILSFKLLRFIYIHTRQSSICRYCHTTNGKQGPAWAVVTGASDGIGRSLAIQLASRGFEIIIHGRNPKKLERVKEEITKNFPDRSVRIFLQEAAINGPDLKEGIDKFTKSIKDINITVLINNVGGAPPYVPPFETFDKSRPATIDTWTTMNLHFTLYLTSALLPTLIENHPSLLMTITSLADIGTPWTSLYSGSKAFLVSWSRAISREMRAEGNDVEVLAIPTGKVTSVSFRSDRASFFLPDADTYAKATLNKVGCGEVVVSGYWTHGIMRAAADCMPEWLLFLLMLRSVGEERARESDYNDRPKSD
jgi:17beta-estradiol 17-dehydrogenase / very-long-chain 3-oxoacyl-CoA reductase